LVGNQISVKSFNGDSKYRLNAGNFRVTLAKRFLPARKIRKKLKPLDDLLEKK
jgi:hypothetical protein